MADSDIPGLPLAAALSGAEQFHIVQGGQSVRVSLATLATWIKTAESIVPVSEPVVGAEVTFSADFATTAVSSVPAWGNPTYDVGGPWWTLAASTRLTVPAGVTKVDVSVRLRLTGTGNNNGAVRLLRNGTTYAVQTLMAWNSTEQGASVNVLGIPVLAGDFFEVQYDGAAGRTITVVGSRFGIRAAEMLP